MTQDELRAWRNGVAAVWERTGAAMFMSIPDAWYEEPHWMCVNGHVSARYLTGESGIRCLACGQPVIIGPPIGEEEFRRIVETYGSE